MNEITFKCVKCGNKFKKDPTLAIPMMLCDECASGKYDLPPGFDKIFGGKL